MLRTAEGAELVALRKAKKCLQECSRLLEKNKNK